MVLNLECLRGFPAVFPFTNDICMEVFLLSFAQARKKIRLCSEDIYVAVNGDLDQSLLQFLTFGCF